MTTSRWSSDLPARVFLKDESKIIGVWCDLKFFWGKVEGAWAIFLPYLKISRCSGALIWKPGKGSIKYCLVLDGFLASNVVKGKEYKTLSFFDKRINICIKRRYNKTELIQKGLNLLCCSYSFTLYVHCNGIDVIYWVRSPDNTLCTLRRRLEV